MLSHTKSITYLLQVQLVFICLYLLSAVFVADNSYNGFNSLLLGGVFLSIAGVTYYVLNVHINRTMFGAVLGSSCILVFIALESSIFWGQISNCSTPTAPILIGATYRQSERPLVSHSYIIHTSSDLYATNETSTVRLVSDLLSSSSGDGVLPVGIITRLLASDHYRYGPECNSRTAMRFLCAFSVFLFLSYIAQVALLVYFKNDLLNNSNNHSNDDPEVDLTMIDSTQQYSPYNISRLVKISMNMNRLERWDKAAAPAGDRWSIYPSSTEV